MVHYRYIAIYFLGWLFTVVLFLLTILPLAMLAGLGLAVVSGIQLRHCQPFIGSCRMSAKELEQTHQEVRVLGEWRLNVPNQLPYLSLSKRGKNEESFQIYRHCRSVVPFSDGEWMGSVHVQRTRSISKTSQQKKRNKGNHHTKTPQVSAFVLNFGLGTSHFTSKTLTPTSNLRFDLIGVGVFLYFHISWPVRSVVFQRPRVWHFYFSLFFCLVDSRHS